MPDKSREKEKITPEQASTEIVSQVVLKNLKSSKRITTRLRFLTRRTVSVLRIPENALA